MGFWENKMGGGAPAPRPLPPMPGQRTVEPARFSPQGKTQASVDSHCPECGSANYGSAHASAAKTCFDCGFGNAYRNSASGGPAIRSEGAVKAAKQIPSNGYNPQEIIGRLQ